MGFRKLHLPKTLAVSLLKKVRRVKTFEIINYSKDLIVNFKKNQKVSKKRKIKKRSEDY